MVGRPQDRKNPKEKDADGHWNVAEAVIAMANSRGGVVLIGIDDDGRAVGLQAGDPRKIIQSRGLETYRRSEIKERLAPANKSPRWETGIKGCWELEKPWPSEPFTIWAAEFEGHDIAAILVPPVPAGGECIIALQNDDERLLRRTSGHIGQVETVRRRRAIAEVEASRCPEADDLAALWDRFHRRFDLGGTEEEDLEAAIAAWQEKFRGKVADLLVEFTPLDAEERPPDEDDLEVPISREVFEPQATETLPDYLRDDFFDELEDELPTADSTERHPHRKRHEAGRDEDWDEEDKDYPAERLARRGGLFELLANESRAVVVGEPGGGKTTCLRRLALDAVLGYKANGPVTLYVPLSRWQAAGGLWALIRRVTGLSPGQVERLISSDRCRLLLDALNECPDAIRPTALNSLAELLRTHPDLPVVITSRSAETTADLRLPTFAVEPLSAEQRKAFLEAYLRDPSAAQELLNRIEAQPGGESLASNPLLLRMIIEVARRGGELPLGRAALYRQWISDWFAREAEKAKVAGEPLPWSIEETRRGLARIALASRREGKRFATDELALETLADAVTDPVDFLERMTQGPLIQREEGRIEFRHETFQEYLCAEALLADPLAVSEKSLADKTTWGMVIVQAGQLGKLPGTLKTAAWAMDPWLGAVLAPYEEIPQDAKLRIKEWNDNAQRAFQFFHVGGDCPPLSGFGGNDWYKKTDSVLSDAISAIPQAWERWLEFEAGLIRAESERPGIGLGILQTAIGESTTLLAKAFCDGGGCPPQNWIRRVSPISARKMIGMGICLAEDFFARRPNWIATATPKQAAALIKAGICNPEDFATRRQKWIAKATPEEAAALIKTEICTTKDFAARCQKWIENATPNQAAAWIKAGICTSENCVAGHPEWIAKATPSQAAALIKAGVCTSKDCVAGHPEWIANATPNQVEALIKAGICTSKDCVAGHPEWIANATPNQAAALIKTGICASEDFAVRRHEWLAKATPKQAVALIEAGFCTSEDFAVKRPEWIANATPKQAAILNNARLCTSEDFAVRRTEWIAKATPKQAATLIKAGFCTSEDFAVKRPEWIANATPKQAAALIKAALCTCEDFAVKRPEWIANAMPNQAAVLIKVGFCTCEDFAVKRPEWIANATPKQAATLIKAGFCTSEDLAVRHSEWIAKATPKQVAALISAEICTAEDFVARRAEWIATATPLQAAALIEAGVCPSEDFAAKSPEWIKRAVCELGNDNHRKALIAPIRATRFLGVVVHTAEDGSFGFISSLAFSENVFCSQSAWPKTAREMKRGIRVLFLANLRENKKKRTWRFVAEDVELQTHLLQFEKLRS